VEVAITIVRVLGNFVNEIDSYGISLRHEVEILRSAPMSYLYQALVLLPMKNHPSLDLIKERIQKVFKLITPTARMSIRADRLTITIDDWEMNIQSHSDAKTIAASQNIVRSYLEEEDPLQTDLANYGCHIEVNCDPDVDPQMNHFNYYVSVLNALANFHGAIIFNPITQGFIE
jgi:hypothetical protein